MRAKANKPPLGCVRGCAGVRGGAQGCAGLNWGALGYAGLICGALGCARLIWGALGWIVVRLVRCGEVLGWTGVQRSGESVTVYIVWSSLQM